MPRRRQVLRTSGALLAAGIAGCLEDLPGTPGDSPTAPPTTEYRGTGYATTTAPYTDRSPKPLSPAGDWTQFQADGANTGTRDGPGVPDGTVYWKRRVPGTGGEKGGVGSPVVSGESLFIGAFEGGDYRAVRLSAVDGTEVWSSPIPGWLDGSLVAGETLVAPTNDGARGLDPADGSEVWTGDPLVKPTAAGGTVYGGTGDGRLRAMDMADGTTTWTVDVGAEVNNIVAVDGDLVVAGTAEPDGLVGRAADDGSERWRVDLPTFVRGAPVIGPDRIYVAAGDAVRAYGRDGSEEWAVDLSLAFDSGLALGEGVLYAGGTEELVALDPGSGDRRWAYPTKGAGRPAAASGTVYLGTSLGGANDPAFYAIDSAGEFAWNQSLPVFSHTDMVIGGTHHPPAVVDGAVYLAAMDSLYAFGPFEG